MKKILCDMCGSKDAVYQARIEGTELNVCEDCSSHGEVISKLKKPQPAKKKKKPAEQKPQPPSRGELVQAIVPDYRQRIKNKREKLGLKQEDAAKKLNIKESLLHKMETGNFEPNIPLARKLERFFGIKLVDQYQEQRVNSGKSSSDALTIGDFIKVKKK